MEHIKINTIEELQNILTQYNVSTTSTWKMENNHKFIQRDKIIGLSTISL